MNRSARLRVGFALLALCLSCAACFPGSPDLEPTPLPSATQHVIPTSTPTQAATIPPTSTRRPAPTAVSQARINRDSTGKLTYSDNVYDLKITFPDGWLLINLTAETLKQAFAETGVNDPDEMTMIADTIAQFPQGARFIGFLQADILNVNGTGTTAVLQPLHHSTTSAEEFSTFLEGVTETLRTDLSSVRLLDAHLLDPISGHPIGRVDLLQEIALNENDTVVGRYVYFYIQTSEDILMLMIGSQEVAFPMIESHIPEIFDSMEFSNPWP